MQAFLQDLAVKLQTTITPQGSYKHTIENIEERTSLPRHFINRCSSKLSDVLDQYRQYGDNNQLFYNDNGLMVFDHIAQLKREGKTIPEIRETLENELQSGETPSNTDRKSLQNSLQNQKSEPTDQPPQTDIQARLIEALQQSNEEVREAKDEVIESQRETIESLRENVKLITDGRDPEAVKEEHEKKVKEAAQKEQEIEKLREEKKRRKERERQRQQKREKLLAELKSLEGKWFYSGRRQEIIAKLERLDRLDNQEKEQA